MSAQPNPFSAAHAALQAKLTARAVVRHRFNELLLQAAAILDEADKIATCGLTNIEVQQARAASKIAGVTFYSLPVVPDAVDFRRLDEDLRHLARSVDPLIEAIGADARSNSAEMDEATFKDCFKDVIENAILGNACHVLDICAEAAREAIEDAAANAEHRRMLQEAE